MNRLFPLLLISLLPLVGCPEPEDETGDEEGSVAPTLMGSVARAASAAIAPGGDGVGVLYVAALASCSLDAETLGGAVVADADLSELGSQVLFSISDLPEGTVALALFLDDNGDADPMAPAPGPGDILFADAVGDGVLSCVEATHDDDVEIVLTASIPLPSISGTVRRGEAAMIAEGNDGVGTVGIAAFSECALDAQLVGATVVLDADLSDLNTTIPWEIADVPPSTVHLAFFLDDNGDADPEAPAPGPGDLLFASGIGDGVLSCLEVTAGEDGLDLELNNVIPWP
ncbi:MAG: hypothetical protein JKY37_04205 [Nannocystaceae bacterium]|nr:hypothetical protein [Nannocystaceae bacterium]